MDFGFHPLYVVILLALALIIFGPSRLPQMGAQVGRMLREFQAARDGLTQQMRQAFDEEQPDFGHSTGPDIPVVDDVQPEAEAASSEPAVAVLDPPDGETTPEEGTAVAAAVEPAPEGVGVEERPLNSPAEGVIGEPPLPHPSVEEPRPVVVPLPSVEERSGGDTETGGAEPDRSAPTALSPEPDQEVEVPHLTMAEPPGAAGMPPTPEPDAEAPPAAGPVPLAWVMSGRATADQPPDEGTRAD